MSGSGGVSIARARGENRFYNPPAIRQRQQLEQQKRQQKEQEQSRPKPSPATSAKAPTPSPPSSVESDKRTATETTTTTIVAVSEDCASSLCSTNLDRFLESTTPLVPAQCLPKKSLRQWRTRDPESSPYFVLGDLWESYGEWSVYGAGVPLLLNGSDSVVQYYVPYLSGIQLYVDLSKPGPRLRKDESDAESSRETSSDGSSNYERGRRSVVHGTWAQKNIAVPNVNAWKEITYKSKPSMGSSSDECETSNPPGRLVFEYMERDTPYSREPLCDKISVLASQFPELRTFRSCDLSPSSWISVAWYPIYRIPTGPTLQNLEACFLTFHSLSTPCQSTSTEGLNSNGGRAREARRAHTRLLLPIFGLASYKFKVPFWNNDGVDECQKASSLLRAADNWLRLLQVHHPDYSFFVSHHTPRR